MLQKEYLYVCVKCSDYKHYYSAEKQIAKRNTYAWWLVLLYLYGILDAYVDYNFKNFPKQKNKEEK